MSVALIAMMMTRTSTKVMMMMMSNAMIRIDVCSSSITGETH